MVSDIESILKSLRDVRTGADVSHVYVHVDRYNREDKTADLVELAFAIERACSDLSGDAVMPYEAVADHVEELLALTAGADHVDALFRLIAKDRVKSVRQPRSQDMRIRAIASKLGHGQTKAALLAAIVRAGGKSELSPTSSAQTELLACWMHEVVLRGTSLAKDPVAVEFHARLADRGHPLGAMPLTLLTSELEAPTYAPMYGTDAISNAVEQLESGPTSARTIPPPADREAPRATRIDDAGLEERMRVAVGSWLLSARGKAEAKVFSLEPALGNASPGRWLLRALPLECTGANGSAGAAVLYAERAGVEAVWGALFAVASNGGSSSSGLGGAYGRRAAWISLAALVDADALATPDQIGKRAESCRFLLFGAQDEHGWFHDIAWDIGALALRPGGASAAVLAATDCE